MSVCYHIYMSYPKHITEDIRIKIGVTFVQKRTRKQFPSLDEKSFMLLDRDIGKWVDPKDEISIRNFWDSVYAFKLETARKYWVNYLTAENTSWSLKRVDLDDVLITWPRVTRPTLDTILGDPPYTKEQVLKYLQNNPSARQAMRENSDLHSLGGPERNGYPVIGILNNGKLSLEDGNRRALRSVLHDEKDILAYVGEMDDDIPANYWISTGWFWQLVLLASRSRADTSKFRAILKETFKQSEVARTTYKNGVSSGFFCERNDIARQLITGL